MVVAATGFFDGVHLGHRAVLKQLCDLAASRGKRSAVITFWPHPRNVLQQDAAQLRLLTTLEEKRKLVLDLGVDAFEVLPFSREFSRRTSAEFMRDCLQARYGVDTLLLGYDHRLGSDPGQTPETLARTARALGIEPVPVRREDRDGTGISSTRIRRLLSEGDIVRANEFLGRRYALQGVVVAGNRLGRTFGFPTANMQLYEPLKLVPANGVYLVEATVPGSTRYGICNIGCRPTIGPGNAVTIETYLLDFSEDIYGLDIQLSFLDRIRDERRFASVDELKRQLEADRCLARNLLRSGN